MKVHGVVMGCVVMSVWLYMHFLCMSMHICCYECIFMVKVVVHEVIVFILGHHDVVGHYDVDVFTEIE